MFEDILVRDWMSTPVYTILPNTPVATAQKIMRDKAIRRLPVMGEHEIIGIVTLGDIRQAHPSDATTLSIWELNYLWSQLAVDRIMTTPVVTVTSDETILNAAELMLRHKISGIPVLKQKTLVGIITESDIFRMLVRSRQPTETMTST